MYSPYLTEDQCSHDFYHQVRANYNLLPIRTHGTNIETLEGVDIIYRIRNLEKQNVKALLVQEKAPYPPPFEFVLKRDQHDTLLRRQSTFGYRAYFYAFFCLQNWRQLPNILRLTVHFDVDKIPPFKKTIHRIKATPNPPFAYPNQRRRRGYHFFEILSRVEYCWLGLPSKHFPELVEDLKRLIDEEEKFYIAIYDRDKKEISLLFNKSRFKEERIE